MNSPRKMGDRPKRAPAATQRWFSRQAYRRACLGGVLVLRVGLPVVGCLGALLTAGCRIPGYDGPISQSLAASRHLSQRGVAALERGQQEQAEQYLAKAVKACGADPEARRNYAEALWRRGAQVEAIAQFDRALKLDPGNVQLHVRRAEMLLALGQLDAASEAAETAIDLDPKSGAAWAVRGRVAWAGGNARRAMDDLYRALAHTPEDRAVQLDLAEIYRLTGQPHRALQSLQTVTESYSPGEEPPEALHRIGLAYRDLSRHEEAVEALRAARDRGATGADFFTELGLAELAVGRVPEASEAAQQALLLDREHPAAQSLAGKVAAAERQRMLASGAWPRLD